MSPERNVRVAALLSVGLHPASGRPRCAAQDARAVELGLKLAGDAVRLLHVGGDDEDTLRRYLGMGARRLDVLRANSGDDAVPALEARFREQPADIILAGVRAERGEASGMLPYLLAERLDLPLVPHIAEIRRVDDSTAEVLQALPRGQRRALRVPLPFVATVDAAAAAPRQFAYGRSMRAQLDTSDADVPVDALRADWEEAPAKPRPKRLNVVKAKSAADRFKAATAKSKSQGGTVIRDGSDREKAEALMELLLAEGVIR
jgi:electron transfer flavoprotein beta subunit